MNWTETPGSSNIEAHAYDPTLRRLTVRYKGGAAYHYGGVPQIVADGLHTADSVGKYIHSNIKGTYTHRRAHDL